MTEKLLTISETANRLGLKRNTIRQWVFLRKLSYVKVGSAVRICESEIDRIVAEGTVCRLNHSSWPPLDPEESLVNGVRARGG